MKVAEYVVNKLIEYGVTDAFGVPGGVILRLIEAMDKAKPRLVPHLNYHEQMAGFAACGYSQANGMLGVAYATRGPGITNMITCIAEAYQESLPILFITGHAELGDRTMRFENNQELDIVSIVSPITKYASSINMVSEVDDKLSTACDVALKGRKGPVLVDFASTLWVEDMTFKNDSSLKTKMKNEIREDCKEMDQIVTTLTNAKRPILLIGDGLRHCYKSDDLKKIADKIGIPVLSSRGSQDIMAASEYYYGYVGSHGCRYSNFILSKSDLVISIGNRLDFPVKSESFSRIFQNAKLIRIDIDKKEFARKIPTYLNVEIDARMFLSELAKSYNSSEDRTDWIRTCKKIKKMLKDSDVPTPVEQIAKYMAVDNNSGAYVCDVGNNEFWAARAYEITHPTAMIHCSKSYGTLGSAIGRAIGAYYALSKPITCIIGDQGFQFNLQELQFIARKKLPIKIVVVNNDISGMILDHEKKMMNGKILHATRSTDYYSVDLRRIAKVYDINYTDIVDEAAKESSMPIILEIKIDSDISLTPTLPKGNVCQDMLPALDRELYEKLCAL